MRLTDPDDRHSLLAEAIPLEDGMLLAWCITPAGTPHPWLVAPHPDVNATPCVRRCCVPHEQAGRLPTHVQARIDRLPTRPAPLRCGRPTRTGHPCRIPVNRAGDSCHHHQDEP